MILRFEASITRRPDRIIMYRDGVSDSEFRQVLSLELHAMRRACSSIDRDYKPAITFICVQKRHHTRFVARLFMLS